MPELDGARILVTRPRQQAETLCRAIAALGGVAVPYPVLEIAAPQDLAGLDEVIAVLERFDIAIFISANAAEYGVARVRARRGGFPPDLRLGAVGRKTGEVLREQGLTVHLTPRERYDSEGLLALPELQRVAGRRVVIFRGEGGRELLAETLRARGAEVVYAECYRRLLPDAAGQGPPPADIDLAVVTSNEGLRNLFELAGEQGRARLCRTPMVVMSARGRDCARVLGVTAPIHVTPRAGDDGLIEAIRAWRGADQFRASSKESDR